MTGKDWAVLTVRRVTAERIKEITHSKGLTVDSFLNELINPVGRG
jgi:hypothetical protein